MLSWVFFFYIWFSYLYIYFIRKQILIDLFPIDAAAFLLKLWPQLAQSLMWWRKPKGQTTFKWHFHDISLARLTFGSFFPPLFFMYYMYSPVFYSSHPQHLKHEWVQRELSRSHFSTAWAPLQSSTFENAVIRFHINGWQAIFNIARFKLIKKNGMWSFSVVLLGSVTSSRVLSVSWHQALFIKLDQPHYHLSATGLRRWSGWSNDWKAPFLVCRCVLEQGT